VLRKTKEVVFC